MLEAINLHYIVATLDKERVMSYQLLFDTEVIKGLNHFNHNYYVGFSGFGERAQIKQTPINYDFYYFYNMVEDIRTLYGIIKFDKEIAYNDLITSEINRLKNLEEQKTLAVTLLKRELAKYKKFTDEMNHWISTHGSTQLRSQFLNDEDINLSYLIERVSQEKVLLSSISN